MARIWVLSELYYPEQTSTGYLLTKTAEGLAEEFDVKVITGPATNFLNKQSAPAYEVHNKVEIFRCFGTTFSKDSLLGRMINIATQSLAIWWKVMRSCREADVILVVTNPPLLPFVALSVKFTRRTKIVLLMHDVYPEAIIASGMLRPDSLVVRLMTCLNHFLYNQVDKIITLGRDMSTLIQQKLNTNRHTIICIPNWAENDIIFPLARHENPMFEELHLTDKFVVLYAGNMGRTHGIEVMATAAKDLAGTNIHFVVLGFGAKKKWLEEFVATHKLTNVTILAPRPRSEQLYFLNLADVALISFVANMAGISVPSRMYNQMAAGKPIIAVCDDWSELALVVHEEQIGWVVRPGDSAQLINEICTAADNPTICREMGQRAARTAREKYALDRANKAYKKVFAELFA